MARFEFRAVSPIFDVGDFSINGTPERDGTVRLWACGPDGQLAMTATAFMKAC
jgi:3-methylfumaryl-CoA hydratase